MDILLPVLISFSIYIFKFTFIPITVWRLVGTSLTQKYVGCTYVHKSFANGSFCLLKMFLG